MLSLLVGLISEIKAQNDSLLQRQESLEYFIEQEVIASIADGFASVKRELKKVSGNHTSKGEHKKSLKRRPAMSTQPKIRINQASAVIQENVRYR